jgi:hypothetical protein
MRRPTDENLQAATGGSSRGYSFALAFFSPATPVWFLIFSSATSVWVLVFP